MLAGVLGNWDADRVHCVEDATRLNSTQCTRPASGSPRHQPAHQVLKTIRSNIRSSAPEDGHNDARNMLS